MAVSPIPPATSTATDPKAMDEKRWRSTGGHGWSRCPTAAAVRCMRPPTHTLAAYWCTASMTRRKPSYWSRAAAWLIAAAVTARRMVSPASAAQPAQHARLEIGRVQDLSHGPVPSAGQGNLLDAQGQELARRHGGGPDGDEQEPATNEAGELGALPGGRPQDEKREADAADGGGLAAEGEPTKDDVEESRHEG